MKNKEIDNKDLVMVVCERLGLKNCIETWHIEICLWFHVKNHI